MSSDRIWIKREGGEPVFCERSKLDKMRKLGYEPCEQPKNYAPRGYEPKAAAKPHSSKDDALVWIRPVPSEGNKNPTPVRAERAQAKKLTTSVTDADGKVVKPAAYEVCEAPEEPKTAEYAPEPTRSQFELESVGLKHPKTDQVYFADRKQAAKLVKQGWTMADQPESAPVKESSDGEDPVTDEVVEPEKEGTREVEDAVEGGQRRSAEQEELKSPKGGTKNSRK